jgi:hypothetical protein
MPVILEKGCCIKSLEKEANAELFQSDCRVYGLRIMREEGIVCVVQRTHRPIVRGSYNNSQHQPRQPSRT